MILTAFFYMFIKRITKMKIFKRIIVAFAIMSALVSMGHTQGATRFKKITSSGTITTGSAIMKGYLMGTDGTNDVSAFTIYDGTDNTGNEIVPTHGITAGNKGMNGATGLNIDCVNGIYAEFTTSGTAELIVFYVNN